MWLFVESFMWFTSTFAHFIIAGIPTAETAGNISNIMFSLALVFCGVIVQKPDLGWWVWMYFVSPFTWMVEGMLTTAIHGAPVECADNEFLQFQPAQGTCGEYMQAYISQAGGYLKDPSATGQCQFCALDNTDQYLRLFSMSWGHAWRNFGIVVGYCFFNAFLAFVIYWIVRMVSFIVSHAADLFKGCLADWTVCL